MERKVNVGLAGEVVIAGEQDLNLLLVVGAVGDCENEVPIDQVGYHAAVDDLVGGHTRDGEKVGVARHEVIEEPRAADYHPIQVGIGQHIVQVRAVDVRIRVIGDRPSRGQGALSNRI